jgi:hypothetical protein
MVEKGQPLGLTGRFQSIQWAAANAALLLTGVIGGYVAETKLQSLAFATCAALWMLALRCRVALRGARSGRTFERGLLS